MILLQHFQDGTQMKRAISVLKARGSNNSSTVSEFNISADGITLGGPVDVRSLRD